MISAFISGKDNKTKHLRAFAQQNLRGLPFDQLRMDDLRHAREHTGRIQEDMLAYHSIECDLEEVDAFVSHAWDDDHEQRYVALRAWATQFESEHGRTPIIWLGMRSLSRPFSRSHPYLPPVSPSRSQTRLALTNPQLKSLYSAFPSSSRTAKASLFWAGLIG